MKKIIILLLSIISIIYVYTLSIKKDEIIPSEAIRFRVVANSNTLYDQNIKLQLKNIIQNKILELTKNVKTIEEERKILKDNISTIDNLVNNTLKELNYDKKYKINYGYNKFPKKKYKGNIYKEGNYESLVITLGDGNGDNWWCVLFPPYCMLETEEENNNVKYTLFIKDFIDKYLTKK